MIRAVALWNAPHEVRTAAPGGCDFNGDGKGNPVIAYSDQQTIKLAWRQADGWRIETVLQADGDPFGQTVSLALDSSDTPHLTYFVATDLTQLDGAVFYIRGLPKAG